MTERDSLAVWPGWETVGLIGRGSFGAVYEIERDVLGEKEKAALKVLSIPQSDSDIKEMVSDGYDDESITSTFKEHLKSIISEYSLMRKLNGSANVVNCDDVRYVQHDDGFGWDIFIKMELLTPLSEALSADIPEEQVVKIAKDLCRALVQCRHFDIVHRDIKPQNIFVSPLGDYKLGDFGIAKTIEKTSGGTKIGTYKYMAPEVYNNQPYGAGADIYSLGLVLYWLLNERRMPFLPLPPEKLRAGMEEEARMRRFQGEPIPAPLHGSDALKQIVLKACAFDLKDRYQRAEEMLGDLESLSSNVRCSPATSTGTSTARPSVAPDSEDGTVGVFRTSAPASPVKPIEAAVRLLPVELEPEDGTVGMFSKPAPAAPVGTSSARPPVQSEQEEDVTIGVFQKPAPVKANGFSSFAAAETIIPDKKSLAKNQTKTQSPNEMLDSSWYCTCGFKNLSGNYCRNCYKQAPEKVLNRAEKFSSAERKAQGYWICTCGFRNSAWRTSCESCYRTRTFIGDEK